jgi:hypothetical protein
VTVVDLQILEVKMKLIGSGFHKLGRVASATCVALAMTCSVAVAGEIPLVDGTHWVKSTDDVKKAYLVGASNIIQLETAYQADKPVPAERSFSPAVAKGMTGQTLSSVLDTVDKWYAAHPDQLQRPVIETIWFEMVVPGLKANK